MYDQYDTFISQLMEEFKRYAGKVEEENGIAITIEMYNASDSQTTQNSQVEKMINDGCDVICVNLVDRTEPTTVIDLAEKSNVPVIFFNRELVEEDLERWEQLYYVGAKAFESGILEGQIAAETWKRNALLDKNQDGVLQYLVLEGEAGHQDTIVRTEYAVNTIMENGIEVEKIGYAIANWNRAQAQTKMAQMLAEYGTDVGLEAVRSGEMSGTVYNDKEGQARAMLDLAYHLSTDGDLTGLNLENKKYIRLPYSKVLPEDVQTFLNK